jgi:hypothetical protein
MGLKIKEKYVSFTGEISVGERAYFIILDTYGVDEDIYELVKQSTSFNTVVLDGYKCDVFNQKEEVAKFIKKLKSENSEIKIIVYTNGTIRPISISEKVEFVIRIQLKHTNISYDKRIIENVIFWFNQYGSKFSFYVKNIDGVDEVALLINQLGISKKDVYISFSDVNMTDMLLESCRQYGYNYSPLFKDLFWNKLGRI